MPGSSTRDTVAVGDRQVRARAFLVATGASPAAPPIPGLEEADYLTSTTALELKQLPGRLVIIGANAVGLELGQFFGHLGSQVTFVDVAGVEVDGWGAIRVDAGLRTTNPRVWAAGDVVAGVPQFVYVPAYHGSLAAGNALLGADRKADYRGLPRVTFTAPQIAGAGLTEAQARDAGHEVRTSVLGLEHVPRALVNRDTRGVVKLVADASSGRLLGATMVADNAGDAIQAAVLAIRHGLTVDELAATFHPYLTMAEGWKLAAQTFDRDVTKLSCCAA